MNIFVTDPNPVKCAQYLDSKRVVKMLSESMQLLCTAVITKGVNVADVPMRATHRNHPSNVWARSSRSNYLWLCDHFEALCKEKVKRYPNNRPYVYHNQVDKMRSYANLFGDIGLTPFANCAANASLGISYKHVPDVFKAYQLYLNDRWDTDKIEPKWS